MSDLNDLFQDGASVHRTQRTLNYIQSSFGTRTLALGSERWGGASWSPNSPDLAPLDFCIWGVMKVRIRYLIIVLKLILSVPATCLLSPNAQHEGGAGEQDQPCLGGAHHRGSH